MQIKLPLLRKFEFVFTLDLKGSNDDTANRNNALIAAFQTSFWIDDQRCCFTYDYVTKELKFRFYTTPICIDDFDNQSIRYEVSSRDNACRLILPSTENMINSININVCQGFFE
jgi:hypothetical protein